MSLLSPDRIKMIGARSLRWPDIEVVHWNSLRSVIEECRTYVTQADAKIDAIETDRDLSPTGRLRKIGTVALESISGLNELPALKRAESAVARFLEQVDGRKGNLPKAPTTPADVQLHTEIRANVAKQKEPLMFAMKHRGDPLVVAAIIHAPAFLSGMDDKNRNVFYAAAANSLWPDDERVKKESSDALQVAQAAIGEAVRVIAQRGQILQTAEGYEMLKAAV